MDPIEPRVMCSKCIKPAVVTKHGKHYCAVCYKKLYMPKDVKP